MSDTHYKGGCMCGAVSYEISSAPMLAAHCCCNTCRKASGADHATNAFFAADNVKLTGEVKSFAVPTDSGNTNTKYFCPNCGSRIYSTNSARDGVINIHVGSMDDPTGIEPKFLAYAANKSAWDTFNDQLPQFEKMPPPPPKKD